MAGVVVEIDEELCDNTQTCEAICPVDVFELKSNHVVVVRPNECLACFRCVELCPGGAITVDY